MRNEKELSGAIRSALKKRKLTKDQLAGMLAISPTMADKLLCGDIEPSRHLEKKMIEVLGIDEDKVLKLAARRQRRRPPKARTSSAPKAA